MMTVRKQHKLIYGVGDNDADYIQQIKETIGRREDGRLIQKVVWVCPFYRAWSGMLQRCKELRLNAVSDTPTTFL